MMAPSTKFKAARNYLAPPPLNLSAETRGYSCRKRRFCVRQPGAGAQNRQKPANRQTRRNPRLSTRRRIRRRCAAGAAPPLGGAAGTPAQAKRRFALPIRPRGLLTYRHPLTLR